MFHREGYKIILITTISIGVAFIFVENFVENNFLNRLISIAILVGYLFILQQFRDSKRAIIENSEALLSPVDGKITNIEEIDLPKSDERGYLLTFYVSPFNFHVVRAPFKGLIEATTEEQIGDSNLRITSIQIENESKLTTTIHTYPAQFSQNARLYPDKNSTILQGEEIGFIKFDAKVTMTVPKSSKLQVKINDRIKAGEEIIATI